MAVLKVWNNSLGAWVEIGGNPTGLATASGLTVSATSRVLGRKSAGAGAIEELTIGTDLLAPSGDGSALTGIPPAQILAGGRLTLESGVSVSTTDQTAKTVVYYTPHVHDQIGIYTGSVWVARAFAEISIALTKVTNGTLTNGAVGVTGISSTTQLVAGMEVTGTGIAGGTTISSVTGATTINLSANATADGAQSLTFKIPASKLVDIYATWTGAAVELVFGPLWTNTTTRATAIAQQNGVWVQSGTATRRLLGTVGTTTTAGQTDDAKGSGATPGSRLVANVVTVPRPIHACPAYANDNAGQSYSVTATTCAAVNGGTNATASWVVSVVGSITGGARIYATNPAVVVLIGGIGIDTTTSIDREGISQPASGTNSISVPVDLAVGPGLHTASICAYMSGAGTATVYADDLRRGHSADPYVTYLSATVGT